jgi:hypothetical protein
MFHYIFFDGCSHFVDSLEFGKTDDNEIVFKSKDLQECFDKCDDLNAECMD